ncbi:MAG: type III-B CRISPR module-associated protein Cmr5 [Peptococcaceae bacterium]|nr:type III-B CRISPR module-associated protein Cmr5 [Peptococcaceae bacterium]
MKQTIEQRRALHALQKVEEVQKKEKASFQEKYVGYVESLPAAILMNGLGQAAATLLSAAKGDENDAHRKVYDHLEDWLCRQFEQSPYYRQENHEEKMLMKAITTGDRWAYQKAQSEALAWLQWLKKFSVAYLKQPGVRGS